MNNLIKQMYNILTPVLRTGEMVYRASTLRRKSDS